MSTGRQLAGADLSGEDLRDAHLEKAMLDRVRLRGANLQGVDLRGASLREATLDEADLRDARLDDATLTTASLVRVRADGASFARADLALADLAGADLRHADLSLASLSDTNLTRARLDRAILRDASLIGAELRGASLRDAILAGANLREAHVEGANFAGARFAFTVLAASDLSRAHGLDAVRHDGPSTVGIDAFLLSRGEIPDAFLAGAGMSRLTIEYLKSVAAAEEGMLVGDAVFLVFGDADRARARRIRAYLRMHGTPAWYWQEREELAGAHNPELGHRVRFHDRVLVLVPGAGAAPGIRHAIERESDEGRRLVFAARTAEGELLDSGLVARIVADFTAVDWSDPTDVVFRRELDRLIAVLSS